MITGGPIYWSKTDSADTIVQIKKLNAKWTTLCVSGQKQQ